MTLLDRLSAFLWPAPALQAAPAPEAPKPVQRRDSFVNAFTGLGGTTDKTSAARPGLVEPLSAEECESLYRSNGYAAALVDRLASASVRRGWEVSGAGVDQVELAKHERRLQVPLMMLRAATLGRLYGGAVVVPVLLKGVEPLGGLEAPLRLSEVDTVSHLMVCECAYEARPLMYEDSWSSPQVGLPRTWQIQPDGAMFGQVVHHTRVAYVAGQRLSRRMFRSRGRDDSAIQRAYEAIRAISLDDQTLANLGQDLSTDVIFIKNLAELTTGSDHQGLTDRLSAIAMGRAATGLVVLDGEDGYENRSKSLAGLKDIADQHKAGLSAAANTPATLLYGDAPAGFNTDGESWRKQWAATVHDFQESELRAALEFIYRLIFASVTGPTNGAVPEFTITFRPVEEPSETDLATLRKTYAEIDAIYMTPKMAGSPPVYTPADVRKSRFGPDGYSTEMDPVADLAIDDPGRVLAAAA